MKIRNLILAALLPLSLAGASLLACSASAFAADAQPSTLTAEQRAEVRALVQDVLKDADSRATLASGATAGIGQDGKVFIQSEDGSAKMNIGGLVQVRYNYDTFPTDAKNDVQGFDLRRVLLQIQGNFGSVGYYVGLDNNVPSNTGTAHGYGVEEAYLTNVITEGWTAKAGKFTLPFSRESIIGAGSQVAVERGVVNNFFSLNYATGAQIQYSNESDFVSRTAISTGANTNCNAWNNAANADFAAVTRADWLVFSTGGATMVDFNDNYGLTDGRKTALLLGGAAYFEDGNATGGIRRDFGATADATFKVAKFSIAGAGFIARQDSRALSTAANKRNPFAGTLTVDYRLNDAWDVFGTAGYINDDTHTANSGKNADELFSYVVGANYRVTSHLKLTADVGYYIGGAALSTVAPSAYSTFSSANGNSGLSPLPTDRAHNDEIAVRLQAQIKF